MTMLRHSRPLPGVGESLVRQPVMGRAAAHSRLLLRKGRGGHHARQLLGRAVLRTQARAVRERFQLMLDRRRGNRCSRRRCPGLLAVVFCPGLRFGAVRRRGGQGGSYRIVVYGKRSLTCGRSPDSVCLPCETTCSSVLSYKSYLYHDINRGCIQGLALGA